MLLTDHRATANAATARGRWRVRRRLAGGVLAVALTAQARPGRAQTVEELRNLSVEQLGEIQVTSVAKSPQSLSDAPAAIYVISHDDIIRSGATTIPEMLRLAPNLEVAQLNATSYAISARGFNVGDNASLSNKLLVLIDGRSVYSPMFGGVYWDMQNVLPENIERIEVISGPGAALWGANAVNGVINIITRASADTQGGVLTLGAGNYERDVAVQYGGRLAPDLTYRAYGEYSVFNSFPQSNGQSAGDGWSQPQGGFRLDWAPPHDSVSLQGDLFTAAEDPNGYIWGRDLATTWHHQFEDGSSVQLLAYYEQDARTVENGPGFWLTTYDIELQHNFNVGGWNDIVWGVGERSFSYQFENTALALVPSAQTLNLANIFAQDTIPLGHRVKLTLGLKLEDEPYAGPQAMPSVRVAWTPFELDAALGGGVARRPLAHADRCQFARVRRAGGHPERIERLPAGDADRLRTRHAHAGLATRVVFDLHVLRRLRPASQHRSGRPGFRRAIPVRQPDDRHGLWRRTVGRSPGDGLVAAERRRQRPA